MRALLAAADRALDRPTAWLVLVYALRALILWTARDPFAGQRDYGALARHGQPHTWALLYLGAAAALLLAAGPLQRALALGYVTFVAGTTCGALLWANPAGWAWGAEAVWTLMAGRALWDALDPLLPAPPRWLTRWQRRRAGAP